MLEVLDVTQCQEKPGCASSELTSDSVATKLSVQA